MNKKTMVFLTKVALSNLVLVALSFLKVNTIIGAPAAYFSLAILGGPLVGLYAGVSCAGVLYAARFLIKFFAYGLELSPINMYIPTLCGAAYWSGNRLFFRLLLPLLCMVLFLVHPVGNQAWAYSLYWLIPVALYWFSQEYVVLHALANSFIMHAVGSVIWLYCVPMSAEHFMALIPVVLVERMIIALSMTIVITGVEALKTLPLAVYKRLNA
ncbi:MAG: hypothetical protein AB7R69_04255 [Candidatus Babeliales bacterium]